MPVSSRWGLALTALATAGGAIWLGYRHDMALRRTELAAEAKNSGGIDYAREGAGRAVLVIHGAGGGHDQGLMLGRALFGAGHDLIAPSRFGYLGTPLPADPSPAAQADAHAGLLDRLGVERAIVAGVSAGAPSAVELALRHPEKVSALILISPHLYEPTQVMGAGKDGESQAVLGLVERSADFLFWAASKVAHRSVVRFLGVPPEVEAQASPAERARVRALIRSILPLSARTEGLRLDGSTVLAPWPLERIAVPTLIVTATDDLYQSEPGARFTAERIKGAELLALPSGGHLLVGRTEEVRAHIAKFLR